MRLREGQPSHLIRISRTKSEPRESRSPAIRIEPFCVFWQNVAPGLVPGVRVQGAWHKARRYIQIVYNVA